MTSQRSQLPIENPTLELKIISASHVSHLDVTNKVDVYAVVSVCGDNSQKKQAAKTPIDYDGGSNPTWNHTVKFSINERESNEGLLNIKVKLYSYWLEGDNDLYLGEVNVSVQELLASNPLPPFSNVNKMKFVAYPVKFIGETKPNSMMSLSYRFIPVPDDELYPPAPNYLPKISQPINPISESTRSDQALVFPPQFQTTKPKLILELVIKFAKDIKDVNSFSAMDVYASVVILKDKQVKQRINTPISYSAYKNPKWNHAIEFFLDEVLARDGRLNLLVELKSHRPFLGDKDIGKVKIPIQELLSSNPPSPLTNDDANRMKLEAHALTGPYGKKGTMSFTYRFLTEQVTFPAQSTVPQPYIMYIPASHQSYPNQGTLDNMTIQSGANAGPSNGLVPMYMAPPYQLHGYQQYSPPQPQAQLQNLEFQPLLHQPRPDTQSQSHKSPLYQQYTSSEPFTELTTQPPPPPPPQQPTHFVNAHAQCARPKVKPKGGAIGTLGLGAAALGRVIGGALISDMISDSVNIFDFEACEGSGAS